MRFAVLRFPGSNCDQDCYHALRDAMGVDTEYVWHKDSDLDGFDAIVVPGGFSYGDALRCGAIARFSPVMAAVKTRAAEGALVIGICNGFQILCEAGLLPGALVRNRSLRFVCAPQPVRVENNDTPFTLRCKAQTVLDLPVAHGEGCYVADEQTLRELNENNRIIFRYVGHNPNGSLENIAGICNAQRNVLGLMPHPDRACEARLGSTGGLEIFGSMIDFIRGNAAKKEVAA